MIAEIGSARSIRALFVSFLRLHFSVFVVYWVQIFTKEGIV